VDKLRAKVDRLASPEVFGKFGSLKRHLAREGLADDVEEEREEVGTSEAEKNEVKEGEDEVVRTTDSTSAVKPETSGSPIRPSSQSNAKTEHQLVLEAQARTRLSCEVVGQYLPRDVLLGLMASYE
jgi:hypothetical protein